MEEKKYIITVGRQYGCGGRELAEILAEKLGVHLYDRQIVHLAAAKLGINDLNERDLLELENTVKPLSSRFIPFHSFGMAMGESSQGMFMAESNVVRKLADDGPCIFLGRCADYALRKRDDVFSIFVCADDEFREERGRTAYEGKSLKELNRENETRALLRLLHGAQVGRRRELRSRGQDGACTARADRGRHHRLYACGKGVRRNFYGISEEQVLVAHRLCLRYVRARCVLCYARDVLYDLCHEQSVPLRQP